MNRLAIFVVALLLTPSAAQATHVPIPATWDFETPVNASEWSTTTRTQYLYTLGMSPDLLSSNLLGPLSTSPLDMAMVDVFSAAQPYSFSFDLILLDPSPPTGFSVVSHGQVIVQAGDLSAAQPIGSVFGGGTIFRFSSLISPGPIPQGGPGSCCGDVAIQWSLPGGTQWGIDNFVIANVPEPGSAILLGLGLVVLARRRGIRDVESMR